MQVRTYIGIIFFSVLLSVSSYAQRVVIQAEDAVFFNGKIETEHAGYTGRGYMNFDNAAGTYIEWEFSMAASQVESLYVYYAHGTTNQRPLELKLNDSVIAASLDFPPTGAWTNWRFVTAAIPIRRGLNKLRLTSLTSPGGPNLDRIEITGQPGPKQFKLITGIIGKGKVLRQPNEPAFDSSTVVTLTAVPDTAFGAVFTGWSGDLSGTNPVQTLTMNSNKNVTATFFATRTTVIYVSPAGNDLTGNGTIDNPYKTVYKSALKLTSGDSLVLRGGVYVQDSLILRNKSLDRITVAGYPGETPVIDGTTGYDAVVLYCTNSIFKDFNVRKAGHNAFWILGHGNRIERCHAFDNGDSGFKIGSSGQPEYPRNNFIVNCDSYRNYDTRGNGGNADGFSAKWMVGAGNEFWGCRAWNNSDDGWDNWQAESTVVMKNCWAFRNGYDVWGVGSEGNGNGFKLGGEGVNTAMVLYNCVSFDNYAASGGGKGFDQNHNLGGHTMYNNTSVWNKGLNFNFYEQTATGTLRAKNNISYKSKTPPEIKFVAGDGEVLKNSWQGFTVTDNDFVSLDTSVCTAPRRPDGSLPVWDVFRLKPSSPLVDAGVNVGLPYTGTAPDLGAFEVGLTGVENIYANQGTVNDYLLIQNYPNPFNPSTRIIMVAPVGGYATLDVYDVLGRQVARLFEGNMTAGQQQAVKFDASGLAGGVYFAIVQCSGQRSIQKMIFNK